MTHINPDGKAVGGPQPPQMALLHIYSQPYEHSEARIIGNDAGLRVLFHALADVLVGKKVGNPYLTPDELFAGDGEGYQVQIILMPDDWSHDYWRDPSNGPHYCDRGYSDDVDRIAERVIDHAIARLKELNNARPEGGE